MYSRWPHSPPFFIPPATPKLALAPALVIHPPPVTKSLAVLQLGAPQVTSASAEEMMTFATLGMTTCSALTVRSAGPWFFCSLMTTCPPAGSEMVWFGAPETAIVWPLMTRLASSELREVAGPFGVQTAIAEAMSKSAEMELPPTVRLTSATDASERLRSPWPTVEACSTSTESKPGTLADSKEA